MQKIKDQNQQLDEKLETIRGHERNIRFLREQDELRVQLMKETPEDYIKQIIEKHIVKPKFESEKKSKSKQKDEKKSLQELQDLEKSLAAVEQFVLGFVDMHTNTQIQKQQAELKR